MEFLVFTFVGIAAAIVHLMLPGQHRVTASAFVLGVFGAWGGALFAGVFHQGGWAMFGDVTLLGAALGAAGAIASVELAADVHVRRDEQSL